jgi:hypothetical protein
MEGKRLGGQQVATINKSSRNMCMRGASSCGLVVIKGLVGNDSSRTMKLEGRQRVLEEGGEHHAMVVDCCMCNPVVTTCVGSTMVAE